jgi:hypothetical protein
MTSTTTATTPLRHHEAGHLFGQSMGLVALTAGLFALGAYIGRDLSGAWAICWFLVSFAPLLAMNVAAQRSEQIVVVDSRTASLLVFPLPGKNASDAFCHPFRSAP